MISIHISLSWSGWIHDVTNQRGWLVYFSSLRTRAEGWGTADTWVFFSFLFFSFRNFGVIRCSVSLSQKSWRHWTLEAPPIRSKSPHDSACFNRYILETFKKCFRLQDNVWPYWCLQRQSLLNKKNVFVGFIHIYTIHPFIHIRFRLIGTQQW